MDILVGRVVLGSYRIVRKLGEGGQGAVYLAEHGRLRNRRVAVKVLPEDSSQGARERFEQEALVADAIDSHRCVRPLDLGCWEDGLVYLAMEYVEGRSLRDELRASTVLEPLVALRIAWRVADTLERAHAKDIVHRDIKPANIMLTDDGGDPREPGVRVIDWGAAKGAGDIKLAHTRAGGVIGTGGYVSPEVILGRGCDGRADVFSLGCMLRQMLTGQLPWNGATFQEVITNTLQEPAPTLADARLPGLAPHLAVLEDVVDRAIEKKPSARPTMSALKRCLGEAAETIAGAQGEAAREPRTRSTVFGARWSPSDAATASEAGAPLASVEEQEVGRLIDRFSTPRAVGQGVRDQATRVSASSGVGSQPSADAPATGRVPNARTLVVGAVIILVSGAGAWVWNAAVAARARAQGVAPAPAVSPPPQAPQAVQIGAERIVVPPVVAAEAASEQPVMPVKTDRERKRNRHAVRPLPNDPLEGLKP